MVDLSTSLCGVKLKNPTVLAAGILGVTSSTLVRVAGSGAGAVTIKSIGPVKREGHKNPVVVEVRDGLLNAVGLSCPEPDEAIDELKKAVKEVDAPVIASFYGRTVEEFRELAERITEAEPDFLEANISCPNIGDEFGKPFGANAGLAAKVTCEIKNSSETPLIVKLTPNVPDIKEIARSVEDAGADCIAAINTLGPGMVIDIETAKPVLSNKSGGLSGPAIKPVAIRCVYEIYETVDIPVIGIGGVQDGSDAVEMFMAGASAVGVGTAVWKRGINVFDNICRELEEYMDSHRYDKLDELIAKAH
ncbi:MAG: dihydroorotate dehydrogenase [Candidatus Altiarchaeota archaeon]|nr:dihydroorotate dehydrogenase [Candidatus Altiarchaeota archaeon]